MCKRDIQHERCLMVPTGCEAKPLPRGGALMTRAAGMMMAGTGGSRLAATLAGGETRCNQR